MTNTDLIKELRALTQAGMKDCREALEEAGWDLQKAVDIVKVKGLNIADGRSGRAASEGVVVITHGDGGLASMVEVNCQTDFVANSRDFQLFAALTGTELSNSAMASEVFDPSLVEEQRKSVVAITKENVVVRRWWVEESLDSTVRVFSYTHSNHKLGVLLTLQAPNTVAVDAPEFLALGEELAMQVAAMNPLAVSADRMSPEDLDRQKTIFETQLKEEGKPQAMWDKIMIGKMRKWNTEVCLLEQESVVTPKTSVGQVIKNTGAKLGGEITVVNFIRCQVGEGIQTKQECFVDEVSKLSGVESESAPPCKDKV